MDDKGNDGEEQPLGHQGERAREEMEEQPSPTPPTVKTRKRKIAYTSVHEEFERIQNFFNARYRVIFAN